MLAVAGLTGASPYRQLLENVADGVWIDPDGGFPAYLLGDWI
jgi:hypothetical protein